MKKATLFLTLLFFALMVQADEAMRQYEASGRYYDNQQYDSAVMVGEQALPLLRQKGMKDEEAVEAIERGNIVGVQGHPEVAHDMPFFRTFAETFLGR